MDKDLEDRFRDGIWQTAKMIANLKLSKEEQKMLEEDEVAQSVALILANLVLAYAEERPSVFMHMVATGQTPLDLAAGLTAAVWKRGYQKGNALVLNVIQPKDAEDGV